MDWLPRRARKRIFFTLFRHFRPKNFFSCKTAYAIFKVVYQASHIPKIRKIYGVVAKKCSKMHIFHTFFAIFGQKKFFFKNPASSVFWNHRKLPWYQKSEKTMEWFERNPSGRTDGRTDGRTKLVVKSLSRLKIVSYPYVNAWNAINCVHIKSLKFVFWP